MDIRSGHSDNSFHSHVYLLPRVFHLRPYKYILIFTGTTFLRASWSWHDNGHHSRSIAETLQNLQLERQTVPSLSNFVPLREWKLIRDKQLNRRIRRTRITKEAPSARRTPIPWQIHRRSRKNTSQIQETSIVAGVTGGEAHIAEGKEWDEKDGINLG